MKNRIGFVMALFLLAASVNVVNVEGAPGKSVEILLNGKVVETEVSPYIENGRVLVPVRAISEDLGYRVDWYGKEQRIEIQSPSDKLVLDIGSADYYKNGEKKVMDVPSVIRNDRTFVPLRLVAEEMGCGIAWDGDQRLVNITKYNVVEAKTPYDILSNVASNTRIILTGQEYNLSELDEITIDNPSVHKETAFEGCEYIIKDVSNLVIEAPEGARASIVTETTYANVLSFNDCSGIKLRNITAGHKVQKGYCTGGVIMLDRCRGVDVEKCNLYGCGTYGITALNSSEITVENTEIYECTYGLVEFRNSEDIRLNRCTFRDSEMFSMFILDQCNRVNVTDSVIRNNNSQEDSHFIEAYDCAEVVFSGCKFMDNFFQMFCSSDDVEFSGCEL